MYRFIFSNDEEIKRPEKEVKNQVLVDSLDGNYDSESDDRITVPQPPHILATLFATCSNPSKPVNVVPPQKPANVIPPQPVNDIPPPPAVAIPTPPNPFQHQLPLISQLSLEEKLKGAIKNLVVARIIQSPPQQGGQSINPRMLDQIEQRNKDLNNHLYKKRNSDSEESSDENSSDWD